MTLPHRPFGPTGRDVPVIGLGTWKLERAERGRAVTAVRAALDAGLVHVDTAELYGDGKVESLLGEALAGRRDEACSFAAEALRLDALTHLDPLKGFGEKDKARLHAIAGS